MKISVNDNFMPGCFQLPEPRDEFPVLCPGPSMMVIGNDQERAMIDPVSRQLRKDVRHDRLRSRRDVVDRNHQKIFSRAGCRYDRQKLRGRNRGHLGKFSTPSSLRTRANYLAILRIVLKSFTVNGITDNRDCRTSAMFLSLGMALISAKVTGRGKGLIGARSTALQSSPFAV
jgi:hypothetical protein